MRNKLRSMYLDWFNNFMTLTAFAEHYNITYEEARRVIGIGRKLHNEGLK